MKTLMTVLGVMVISFSGLTGCALLKSVPAPDIAVLTAAAVDAAVATAESKGITGAQINAIAKQVLAADTGNTMPLSALTAFVETQITKLKLPAGDFAAIELVLTALSGAINAQIANNTTVAQAEVVVANVVQDVITATGG